MKITVVWIFLFSFCLMSCTKPNVEADSSPAVASVSPTPGAVPSASPPGSFTVCNGTYALCTSAKCETTDDPKIVRCHCQVKEGLSVATNPCSSVPQGSPTAGEKLPSRYFPITSTAVCSIDGTWAFCLDKECTVDTDTNKAHCKCEKKQTTGKNFVVVAGTATDAMCSSAIWSSATIEDVLQITGFLYAQDPQQLTPSPINILRVETSTTQNQ